MSIKGYTLPPKRKRAPCEWADSWHAITIGSVIVCALYVARAWELV